MAQVVGRLARAGDRAAGEPVAASSRQGVSLCDRGMSDEYFPQFHYHIICFRPQLFEGLKAYRGADDRIRLFRPDLNMERMNRTAARATLPTFDGNELIECIRQLIVIDQEWVPHEGDSTLYVRPSMIGIEVCDCTETKLAKFTLIQKLFQPTLGIANSDSALLFVVLCPVGDYFKDGVAAVSLLADPQYTR